MASLSVTGRMQVHEEPAHRVCSGLFNNACVITHLLCLGMLRFHDFTSHLSCLGILKRIDGNTNFVFYAWSLQLQSRFPGLCMHAWLGAGPCGHARARALYVCPCLPIVSLQSLYMQSALNCSLFCHVLSDSSVLGHGSKVCVYTLLLHGFHSLPTGRLHCLLLPAHTRCLLLRTPVRQHSFVARPLALSLSPSCL